MTITYRRGTPADAPSLAEMMRASAAIAFRVTYPAFPPDSEPPSVEDLAPGWVGITVVAERDGAIIGCLLYTSRSPRDQRGPRMPSSA